jgi:hypothetical protein
MTLKGRQQSLRTAKLAVKFPSKLIRLLAAVKIDGAFQDIPPL